MQSLSSLYDPAVYHHPIRSRIIPTARKGQFQGVRQPDRRSSRCCGLNDALHSLGWRGPIHATTLPADSQLAVCADVEPAARARTGALLWCGELRASMCFVTASPSAHAPAGRR